MLTSLASDSPRNQRFGLRVLSSSLRKNLKQLSKMFDLDEIDCEIICLVKDKFRVQAKEIALHIYLSRDAARRRAIKLTEKELLETVQAKAKSPGVIYFRLSSKIKSIFVDRKKPSSVDFSDKSFMKSQSIKDFPELKKNQSFKEKIGSFSDTRRNVFSLVVSLEQATSPLIADKLGIYPQAVRYHLECLRKDKWIERSEYTDNSKAYDYFLHPNIECQIDKSILINTLNKLNSDSVTKMNEVFEQEISKLRLLDINLLASICHNPGLTLKKLSDSMPGSEATKHRIAANLIDVGLVTRKKDSNCSTIRYFYFPTLMLTIDIVERYSKFPVHIEKTSNFIEDKSITEQKILVSANPQSSSSIIDLFSTLNYIQEQEQKIKEEEKKIQELKSHVKKLKEEMIANGGKEAEKFFSR